MEDDSETTTQTATTAAQPRVDDDDKSDFVNSGLVRESEVESVLAAVQDTARRMNFIAMNSERKESPKLSPRESKKGVVASREESIEAKSSVDNSLQKETGEKGNARLQKRPSVEALAAQFERAASTSTPSTPTSSLKWRSQNHQGSPHSPSTMSDISPSELTFSETSVKKQRSSSLRSDNGDTLLSTSHNRTPSVRSAGSGVSPEPSKNYISGSEGIASRIASLFSGNRRSSKDKDSPLNEPKSVTMNGTVANQNGTVQSPETLLTNYNETVTNNSTPNLKRVSPSSMNKLKQDSVASNMGSDVLSSGDYSTTDIDSSFDLTSPPTSPASSLGASSLTRVNISSPTKRLEGIEARNAIAKKFGNRKKSPVRSRHVTAEWEEGEEDTLGDLPMDYKQRMRTRTKTLSMSSGVSTRTSTELGRQKRSKKEIREKQFALKRHHSLTDLRLIKGTFELKELELISPDFESKIRERIKKAMSDKYGGLERANQAAIKIQQSWRQFKLRRRFQKIKQQSKSQLKSQLQLQSRQRAQSMRDPRRRPSIMKKRKKVYHREASVATISTDARAKTGLGGTGRMVGGQAIKTPTVKISEQLTEQGEEVEREMKKVVETVEVRVWREKRERERGGGGGRGRRGERKRKREGGRERERERERSKFVVC